MGAVKRARKSCKASVQIEAIQRWFLCVLPEPPDDVRNISLNNWTRIGRHGWANNNQARHLLRKVCTKRRMVGELGQNLVQNVETSHACGLALGGLNCLFTHLFHGANLLGCLQVEPPTMQRIVCTVQSDQEIHFWLTGSVRWSTFRGVSNRAGLCLRHPERPRNPALFLSRSTRTGATLVKKSIDKHGRKRIATGSTFRGGCLQLKVFIQHDGKRLVTSCGY